MRISENGVLKAMEVTGGWRTLYDG